MLPIGALVYSWGSTSKIPLEPVHFLQIQFVRPLNVLHKMRLYIALLLINSKRKNLNQLNAYLFIFFFYLTIPLSTFPIRYAHTLNSIWFLCNQIFCCSVFKVNKALQPSGKVNRFIGVLDIYGFETFEVRERFMSVDFSSFLTPSLTILKP